MIPELRKKYNSGFSQLKYENFIRDLNTSTIYELALPIAETPVFLPDDLIEKLKNASVEIISQLRSDEFLKYSEAAIPEFCKAPNEDEHPLFILLDFAVCCGGNGYFPMLIELQGFPSHFYFMRLLEEKYREHFFIPENLTSYYSGFTGDSYGEFIRKILLNGHDPEEVILLEVRPEKQNSRIEFGCTKDFTGIEIADLSAVIKKGNKIFYKKNGKEIRVRRIYSRVIQDEVVRKNIQFNFSFRDELDVEWAGHPNWFFRISKHTLPFLKSQHVPGTFFLNELDDMPADPENYVLKPLFSYSGMGVEINLNRDLLDGIKNRENYILQKKIKYAAAVETPVGNAGVEIRMMFIWPFEGSEGFDILKKKDPVLVNNLARISRGNKMGVEFNRSSAWSGMTTAFHK
jgi:hypothetical protein